MRRRSVHAQLVLAATVALVGCAAVEGLDRYERVDDGLVTPDTGVSPIGTTSGGTSSGDTPNPVFPPIGDASTADGSRTIDAGIGNSDSGVVTTPDTGTTEPPQPNLALGVAAVATVFTDGSSPASNAVDGKTDTVWSTGEGACTMVQSAAYLCDYLPDVPAPTLTIPLSNAIVGQVVILGDSQNPPLSAQIDLLDAKNGVLATQQPAFSNGNADVVFAPTLAGVAAVRITLLEAATSSPGFGEVEVYAQ